MLLNLSHTLLTSGKLGLAAMRAVLEPNRIPDITNCY